MTAGAPAVETVKLTKAFGHHAALRGVDLALEPGQFLALFGPNGAGKTTLLRIIATLTRPTGGTVRLWGDEITRAATAHRRHIGLISHDPLLYGDLTAEENLRFFARMYDVPINGRIDAVLEQVGLAARRRDPVRTFSRGMVQRLSIARAVLHDPRLLLLDEPYTGLDLQAADMLRGFLHDLATTGQSDRTVILTTHSLEQGLEVCNRVAVLARGRIAWHGARSDVDLETIKDIYRDATTTSPQTRGA